MKWNSWALAGAVVLLAVIGAVVVTSNGEQATSAAPGPTTSTATVVKGKLAAMVSLSGTLAYRAGSDGSPYAAINRSRGTYTALPEVGDRVDCGDVFYRVDDDPVLLLCGRVPAYRDLASGDMGKDVRQLNRNLRRLGYDGAGSASENTFTWQTEAALVELQRDKGLEVTGELEVEDAVYLPDAVRIAKVTGELGGSARAGTHVAYATTDALEVQVELDGLQRSDLHTGDRARIILPGNRSVTGTLDRLGTVAQAPDDQEEGAAMIPAYIRLDDQAQVRGLDEAPVQVDVTTTGVDEALSVPVTAIIGKSGDGFAVEVVRNGDERELVPVELGLFDTTGGRVEVEGDLDEGDKVVVPAS